MLKTNSAVPINNIARHRLSDLRLWFIPAVGMRRSWLSNLSPCIMKTAPTMRADPVNKSRIFIPDICMYL